MIKVKDKELASLFVLLGRQKIIYLLFVTSLLQVGLTVYMPILLGQVVNELAGPNQVDFHVLSHLLIQMTLIALLISGLQYLNPSLSSQVVFNSVTQLRNQVMERIHFLPFSYLDQTPIGDLVARVTTDSDQLADGLLMIFNQFFVGGLTIVLTLLSMLGLDAWMMLVVVGLTPLSIIVSRFISSRSYGMFRKQTQARGLVSSQVAETISNQDIIRYYNFQDSMESKFNEENATYANYSKWAIFYSALVNPTTRFINALIYACLTLMGCFRILNGTFSVGALTSFLTYANEYMKPFNDISNVLAELQGAMACFERLNGLLSLNLDLEVIQEHTTLEAVYGRIEFDQVSFSYPGQAPLFENLNFTIEPGQTVAIVGPTGAGKSSLINLLMQFYNLNDGHIRLDGRDLKEYRLGDFRSYFGMVLQDTWLNEASVAENIAYGRPDMDRKEIIKAAKAAHADHFIESLPQKYDTYLRRGGADLSSGQAQLLAIARVIASQPRILILDEATSSIDSLTEVYVQEALDRLMEGRTSFIIAHRLSTIQEADLILVMKDGQLIEYGSHQDLMAQKTFYFDLQTAYLSHQRHL